MRHFFYSGFIVIFLCAACIRSNINGTQPPLLAIADVSNNRVLIYNQFVGGTPFAPASLVLGQPDFSHTTCNYGGVASALTLCAPLLLNFDRSHLFVSDLTNNRVLIWNSMPNTTDQPADVVLGQTTFSGTTANQGGTRNATTLSAPNGMASDGTHLVVADSANARVLIWNHIPTVNGAPADVVLGQPSFSSLTTGVTSQNFSSQTTGDTFVGSRLLVSDRFNQRILGWNSLPTFNQQPADFVLGQVNLTTFTAATSQWQFGTRISGIASDGKHFALPDQDNNRILIWNSISGANAQPADVVLGHADFVSTSCYDTPGAPGTTSAQSICQATGVAFGQNQFFVGDHSNSRTLVWNTIPQTNQQAADSVLGQPNFSSTTANYGGTPSAVNQNGSYGVATNYNIFGTFSQTGY